MQLDARTCYRALRSRDARFDGTFVVGVTTTGIYCRPICPARTPAEGRCRFFASAAAAERDGFRACFRCRPEVAPRSWRPASDRLVREAEALIDAGFLNEASLDALAAGLSISTRHLRRTMTAVLGIGPVALAQSRRLALAKGLLQDTTLPVATVAFASGFGSVRRFNHLFRARFGRPPVAVRRAHAPADLPPAFVLRLDYRPPYDRDAMLSFLAARAIPGVEQVESGSYRRTIAIGGRAGWIKTRFDPSAPALRVDVSTALAGRLMPLTTRLRRLFDLDAHPQAIAEHLARDAWLRPLVERRGGVRVPGCLDPFETTVRALLGQQVSVRAATTLARRLVLRFGAPIETSEAELTHLFPAARTLAEADPLEIARIGLPSSRARAIQALARAVSGGEIDLGPGVDPDTVSERLRALPGIGEWTVQYVGMRVLGWPDAFPASDLGIRQALRVTSTRDAKQRAERWRPWRAYAALHLWNALAEGDLDAPLHDDDGEPDRTVVAGGTRRRVDRPAHGRAWTGDAGARDRPDSRARSRPRTAR